jgi:hypothetical protein
LDKAAGAKGGYVIQGFKRVYNVKKCDGTVSDNTTYEYQEAWPINPGKTVTKWAETGDLMDDQYLDSDQGKATKGEIATSGSATFLDGITLPSDFIENNPNTIAHILPSTTQMHPLTGGSPTISHDLTVEWDCCPNKLDKTKEKSRT